MLGHPDISRQWVLRRLQRALTLDLAAAALQHGVAAGTGAPRSTTVEAVARGAAGRAATVRELIDELGSVPYSSIGMAQSLARIGGRLLGWCGAWAWRPLLRWLAEHTLSEYDVLVAFVDGAAGVDVDLVPRVTPLLESASVGMESLQTV